MSDEKTDPGKEMPTFKVSDTQTGLEELEQGLPSKSERTYVETSLQKNTPFPTDPNKLTHKEKPLRFHRPPLKTEKNPIQSDSPLQNIWNKVVTTSSEVSASVEQWAQNQPLLQDPKFKTFIQKFGHTLLVGLLFFVWVLFDRISRPKIHPEVPKVKHMLLEALEFQKNGDKAKSQERLFQASQIEPNAEEALRIQKLINQK